MKAVDRSVFSKIIESSIRESIASKEKLLSGCSAEILQIAEAIIASLRAGGKLMFCGNGGSAADAQHLAAELVVRLRGSFNRPAIAALALTVDTSVLTAGGNDLGYDQIFARQVEALGRAGDVLIGITTSGNSPNIVAAVREARQRSLVTVGFLGGSGGVMKDLVDLPLLVPSNDTARIQECHILVGHILCLLAEEALHG